MRKLTTKEMTHEINKYNRKKDNENKKRRQKYPALGGGVHKVIPYNKPHWKSRDNFPSSHIRLDVGDIKCYSGQILHL